VQPIITVPLQVIKPRDEGRRLGNHEVIAPLARGGMGGVYLAADLATGERVAVKVLDPHFAAHADIVDRLFAERRISARVRHPGLLDVRHAGRSTDGVPYLVMEYLDGENLGELADRGQLELSAILAIAAQIAAALAALHDVGVIHCDIKLDNVVVLYETGFAGWPKIKVIDFGVSRFVDEPPIGDGAIAGTPACMPPEQWRGAPTAKSDVYALGCLLFELVTGDTVFHGTLPQLMVAHADKRPPRPSWLRAQLPPALERLILRALAKDPAMRPSMDELATALTDLALSATPHVEAMAASA
jgi:serine/threonine-protein kinase